MGVESCTSMAWYAEIDKVLPRSDMRFEPLLQSHLHDEIDLYSKQIFEIKFTAHIVVERLFSFPEIHEHIHIAVRPLLSPGEGTEDPYLCHPEPFLHDWFVLFQE